MNSHNMQKQSLKRLQDKLRVFDLTNICILIITFFFLHRSIASLCVQSTNTFGRELVITLLVVPYVSILQGHSNYYSSITMLKFKQKQPQAQIESDN